MVIMRVLMFLLFSSLICHDAFSQINYKLSFFNEFTKEPIENVLVFGINEFLAVSDSCGVAKIPAGNNSILIKHLAYRDTIISIDKNETTKIFLSPSAMKIDEIKVSANYDATKHLIKILKKNFKSSVTIDTTFYYSFEISNKLEDSEQQEMMSGILSILFEKQSLSSNPKLTYHLEKINFYSNSFTDTLSYKLVPNCLKSILDNNLSIYEIKKKYVSQYKINAERNQNQQIFTIQISDTNKVFYKFINDSIEIVEAYHIHNTWPKFMENYFYLSTYFFMNFKHTPILHPNKIVNKHSIQLSNEKIVKQSIELFQKNGYNAENSNAVPIYGFIKSLKQLQTRYMSSNE